MNQPVKGILFDLDGTLVNSIDCYWLAFNGSAEHFGLGPVDVSRIGALLDRGARIQDTLIALYPSLDEASRVALRSKIIEIYLSLEKERVCLLPGARELLASLKSQGMKIGIATSRVTRDDGKWRELQRFGLDGYIDAVVTAADALPKPAPDTIIECVRQLGLTSPECVFVGDSTCDIIAAREAGLTAFAVTTGVGKKAALVSAGPMAVVDSLAELLPLLEQVYMSVRPSSSR
ncbi:MAG: HAD family hydrolase [Chloroflexota bacterium]